MAPQCLPQPQTRPQTPKPRPIKGEIVRVIEADITVTTEHGTRTERYRLVTSLLDPRTAPAEQLLALYARRWVAETGIREIKTVLLAGRALRGHTPARAMQELLATLCVYQAVRLLICRAALTQDLDPSRISFTAARDTAQHAITTTPAQAHQHLDWAGQDLCRQLITHHTSHRIFPRALKNTLPRYSWRGRTQQLTSTNASYQVQITPPASPETTTHTPAQPRAA
ncbi:transposase [Saccharopolyspora pogona]|uniref:transposase n=1 Tax=Saccharopolyspora pogona TaxID=333966 RepID=UPI00168252C1|nr:transposase [Saccharopolyspora pogona]